MTPPDQIPTTGLATTTSARGRDPWAVLALVVIGPLLATAAVLGRVPGWLALALLAAGVPTEWRAPRCPAPTRSRCRPTNSATASSLAPTTAAPGCGAP